MNRKMIAAGVAGAMMMHGASAFAADKIEAKVGGTIARRDADEKVCTEVARHRDSVNAIPQVSTTYTPVYIPAQPGMSGSDAAAGAAGVLVAIAIVAVVENQVAKSQARNLCMRNLGYAEIELTPDEEDARDALARDERDQWEDTFMAGDVGPRIEAVLYPLVPPLPAYVGGPWQGGPVRVDPDSLTVTEGEIRPAVTALTGKGTPLMAARLREGFASKGEGYPRIRAEAGAIFVQADYRLYTHPLLMSQSATWCGPVTVTNRRGPEKQATYCFAADEDGYQAYPAGTGGWGSPTAAKSKSVLFDNTIKLDVIDDPDELRAGLHPSSDHQQTRGDHRGQRRPRRRHQPDLAEDIAGLRGRRRRPAALGQGP